MTMEKSDRKTREMEAYPKMLKAISAQLPSIKAIAKIQRQNKSYGNKKGKAKE